MMKRLFAAASLSALVVASTASLGGCSRREHLRKDFGAKSSEFFQRQQAASKRAPVGLDPEEAALIHQSYRQTLGKEGGSSSADKGSKVLIVEEPRDDGRRR